MLKKNNMINTIERAVFIVNPEEFEKKIRILTRSGPKKLLIVSDFDRTLTEAFIERDGKRIDGLTAVSVIRFSPLMSEEYKQAAKALHAKFYPIEINPLIPIAKKRIFMHEWWTSHFRLLIKNKLTKSLICDIVKHPDLVLRKQADTFLSYAYTKQIATLIFSAGVKEVISQFLKQKNIKLHGDIIANSFIFDKNGVMYKFLKTILHSFNKGTIRLFASNKRLIEGKSNVLLLGDSYADPNMLHVIPHSTALRIGFVNYPSKENIELFSSVFDVLLIGTHDFSYPLQVLKRICLEKNRCLEKNGKKTQKRYRE